jgi:hypothetical protein
VRHQQSCRRLIALTVAAFALAAPLTAPAAAAVTFPCRWNYDMYVGLHLGYLTGGESADCTGVHGTLTLSAELFRWTPSTGKWRLDTTKRHAWSNPRGNHYVEFSQRCARGRVRAVFNWLLRDQSGHTLSINTIRTAPVADPGPKCALVLR